MKTLKITTVAAVLTLVPAMSFAMGCGFGSKSQQAQTCIQGSAWDAETQTCVPIASS